MTIDEMVSNAMTVLNANNCTAECPDHKQCVGILTQMEKIGYRPNQAVANAIVLYMAGLPLLLGGLFGGGKSAFWKVLSEVDCKTGPIRRKPFMFAVVRMPVVPSFTLSDIRKFLCRHEDKDLVIDDLGGEARVVDYGTRCEALDLILSMRESSRFRTHFTTNIGMKDIKERYGSRIADRMSYAVPILFTLNHQSERGIGLFRVPLEMSYNYVVFDRTVEAYDEWKSERMRLAEEKYLDS